MELEELSWPGSWQLDHVLCEDMGQLVGHGIGAIHDALAESSGVAGRASTSVCMDETLAECTMSLEGRPRCEWRVSGGAGGPTCVGIDSFVDAWYGEKGVMTGWASGTNLRQFFDRFAIGAKATVSIAIPRSGNLHHVYEAAFRALGDAVGLALGTGATGERLAGDTSGLAGSIEYIVERLEED